MLSPGDLIVYQQHKYNTWLYSQVFWDEDDARYCVVSEDSQISATFGLLISYFSPGNNDTGLMYIVAPRGIGWDTGAGWRGVE